VIIHDVRSDPRFDAAERARNTDVDILATVSVPMLKDGRFAAALTVHAKTSRIWTADDVALIQETAERTGAAVERARATAALRESERLARSLLREATSARAEAEAANRAKDEFLATLGHELRTPLAAIVLWARALHAGAVRPEEIRRAVAAIVESAESQSRLIDDLLDLSRLTSGKIELQHSPVDVRRIFEEAVDTIRPAAFAKKITVSTNVERMKGHAWLDERRIKQVLWNVLSNAVKFTPEGGAVEVLAENHGKVLEVVVVDDGEGIEPAFLPHVFEKFRQADMADSRRYMGLGIGLSIAKRLTELHAGTIEAESEGLGSGATFRIRIPWISATAPAPSHSTAPVRSLEGVRTLLVEDDRSTRLAMLASLENAGARVLAFSAAHDALSALADGAEVDVVISDLGLPRMSGHELIGHIARHYERQSKPLPPSCAVSAHAREIDRQAAIEAGFDLHLTKPLSPESLVDAVADLAGMAQNTGSK
jgi:signal transduction histidine kinase/CheY-like chemotaxis protein